MILEFSCLGGAREPISPTQLIDLILPALSRLQLSEVVPST